MKRGVIIARIVPVLLVMVMFGCGKDVVKTPQIVSTREVTNNGCIIVEATFDNASRMCFRIVSATEAEVSSAGNFYFEDSTYWKYEGNVVIPEEFTHYGQNYRVIGIGARAFVGCESLVSVDVPETVCKYIGSSAFANCTKLVKVNLPTRVDEIGGWAFYGCEKLVSISIPEGPKEIYTSTFGHCESLTKVRVPNSVELISVWSFSQCKNLTSVEMPSAVCVGTGAFSGCESLREIKMPVMESVEDRAFSGCTSLPSVELPASTTSVFGNAFEDCTSLQSVTCRATTPPMTCFPHDTLDDPFTGCLLQRIMVPAQSVDAYKTADGWKKYADIIMPI